MRGLLLATLLEAGRWSWRQLERGSRQEGARDRHRYITDHTVSHTQLKLEDEISLGGHTASGQLRGPLHIGDHLPEHAASSAVPRQLIFRASESGKARDVVIVAEPWSASLPSLFPLDAKAVLGATSRAHLALRDALAYMAATKTHFALVTTYEHFVFLRTVDGTVQVSEPITSSDSEATVYAALWVWAREVAKED